MNEPKRQLIPVFAASDGLDHVSTTLALSKAAAARGETVLMLDCQQGELMDAAGIIYYKTLADVFFRGAEMNDVKYVTGNEHFTAIAAGKMSLDILLGSLAALSLDYDWVFVGVSEGCTPAHVRLAGAADASLLCYSSDGDKFMRAYWMMEAVRRRHPEFDPMLMSFGPASCANETALMLIETVKEFLGAPPPYVGHGTDPWIAPKALVSMIDKAKLDKAA
jgi:MinD-like ATPase involved in chromosome partitioning or flagellar assembly